MIYVIVIYVSVVYQSILRLYITGVFSSLQPPSDDLRHDPRDRIADASVTEDAEGSLAYQDSDEYDYEMISKEELDQIE